MSGIIFFFFTYIVYPIRFIWMIVNIAERERNLTSIATSVRSRVLPLVKSVPYDGLVS